ncbi:MAG: hypothetical protein M0C28_45525 [Candidatus Moduliflexus flocculans]|nr:hypothetical protein [Candidatus Moduliflexus flocculans]
MRIRSLKFSLKQATIEEQITVTAPNPIISQSRTGASMNVGTTVIESMPTIGRTFDDFARLAPQVDARGGGAFSAAGTQQPVQQHLDRRRREQRPVRPERQRRARPVGPDLARRRPGVRARPGPLRRPLRRLHRGRPERHHPLRDQQGLAARPITSAGTRTSSARARTSTSTATSRRRSSASAWAARSSRTSSSSSSAPSWGAGPRRPPTSSTTAATPTTSAGPTSRSPTPSASPASCRTRTATIPARSARATRRSRPTTTRSSSASTSTSARSTG